MDFDLTEEQKLIRATARRIAREKVAPRATEIEEKGEYPWDIFQIYKEQGLLGLAIPVEYGGSGAGMLGLSLAIEEVSKHSISAAVILHLTALSTWPILVAGSEEQKQKWVFGVATGEYRGSFGLTDPSGGSDVGGMESRALREDGEYVLNGEKVFITGATVADFFTVFAKTDPKGGSRGISTFIVPREAPGFSVGRQDRKMGVHGVPTAQILMQDCRVPVENRVGGEGEGFRIAMATVTSLRPVVGARGVGLAEGALQYALEYAKQRQAFGQPISNFQALQFKMADMVIQIEAARLLVYQGAWLVDQGRFGREYAGIAAVAKAFASEMAIRVSSEAMQIMGGYGYMEDYPLERMYRDARHLLYVEGTSEIQRVIIARALLDGDIAY